VPEAERDSAIISSGGMLDGWRCRCAGRQRQRLSGRNAFGTSSRRATMPFPHLIHAPKQGRKRQQALRHPPQALMKTRQDADSRSTLFAQARRNVPGIPEQWLPSLLHNRHDLPGVSPSRVRKGPLS